MCTCLARVLTVVALGLTASLTVRAYAAPMTPGTADTRALAALPVLPQDCASGIRGAVLVRSGDLMPPIDPSRSKMVPASVPVYVFQGGVCVATTHSGADGRFELALPAGRYTVVARVSETDAAAQSVQVREDQWTALALHVDVGATY